MPLLVSPDGGVFSRVHQDYMSSTVLVASCIDYSKVMYTSYNSINLYLYSSKDSLRRSGSADALPSLVVICRC